MGKIKDYHLIIYKIDVQIEKDSLCLTNKEAYAVYYLTNRIHVAVRLFSNRSQMTSKCGKNKKVAHEA